MTAHSNDMERTGAASGPHGSPGADRAPGAIGGADGVPDADADGGGAHGRPGRLGFLVLHGWQNRRPPEHWQHWLAGELADRGHEVDYPQLPDPDEPDLATWLGEFQRRLDALRGRERVVVCHSASTLMWLHAVARDPERVRADRVLLVAPPSREVCAGFPEVAEFAPPRVLAPERVAAAAGAVRLVAGDDDPYCPGGAAAYYGRPLGLDTDVVPGGGHLDLPAGYGAWDSVLDWCLDPSVRVGPRAGGA